MWVLVEAALGPLTLALVPLEILVLTLALLPP